MSRRTVSVVRWGAFVGILLVLGVMGTVVIAQKVEEAREAAERMSCNLGGVATAFHRYHEQHGHLPPAIVRDRAGRPLHSWRVLLLPYIEEDALFKELRLDEPWDSPHNLALLPRMPRSYQLPGRQADRVPPHHTTLQLFVGPGTPFEEGRRRKLRCGDGDTILFVEAGEPVPWTKPTLLPYAADRPLPDLRSFFRSGFRSCLLTSCSYRFIAYDTPEDELRALIVWKGASTADR